MNTIEMKQLTEAYLLGKLSKEVLDHMLQQGAITIFEWSEIYSNVPYVKEDEMGYLDLPR